MKDKDETSMLLNEAYSCFYKAYDRINRIAWNGSLPECSFWFYRGRGGRTLAGAHNGNPHIIIFNLSRCLELPNEHIWGILAHEMTHIWQYAQGKRGGHGKDFYAELLRVGVEEDQGWFVSGTPAEMLYFLNEQEPILLCDALQTISKYSSFKKDEFSYQFSRRKYTDALL